MVLLIVVVGMGGGAFGAAYLAMLDLMTEYLGPEARSPGAHVLVLVLVGLVITAIVRLLGRPADVELLVGNIHVPGISDDAAQNGRPDGRLRSLIPVSLLSVAAGGTLGPEAPLVTSTGTVATRLARRAMVDTDDARTLAITGMAAGFSVLFGAPLGSAIFALEIPHRRGLEYYEALVPAAIGSLCGYAVSALFNGIEPIFDIPAAVDLGEIDLAWAVLAGVLGALIGVVFTLLVGALRRIVALAPSVARPALGGLGLGAIALGTPYVLTNGELQINDLIDAPPVASTLIVIAAAKLAGAGIALVTGWRGGFIIPLFFAGFSAGWAIAGWLPIDNEWAFVVGAMVAANVAVTKTPIGSTLVVTEMAGFALGPTALISALTCLVLTSPVGLIDTQRRRFDAYDAHASGEADP